MPVYLVHGFRWPREGFSGIRVHAVLHNLEDTSVEYIQNENSKADILGSFHRLYPEIMKELDGPGRNLEFIEQYNPEDTEGAHAVSQPYAYVGDKVVTIAANPGDAPTLPLAALGSPPAASPGQTEGAVTSDPPKTAVGGPKKASILEPTALSMNVEEVISEGPGLTNRAWEALADLRDKIASGEKIGWWVVYNGDPQRAYLDYDDDDEYDEDYEDEEMEDVVEEEAARRQQQQPPARSPLPYPQHQQQVSQSRSTLVNPTSASTVRPQTAPSTDIRDDNHPASYVTPRIPQVPTSPLPHIASQALPQPQGELTALPTRPAGTITGLRTSAPYPPPQPPEFTSPGRGDRDKGKGKQVQQSEVAPAPKAKETARAQGLRKKFFGKRS